MKRNATNLCPECEVGTLRQKRAFLFLVQDKQPICIPDFTAWVCDICGRREFDSAALIELRAMLPLERKTRQQPYYPRVGTDPDQPHGSLDPQRRR
jgi:YgiT-type zinc finger domain-containing protein